MLTFEEKNNKAIIDLYDKKELNKDFKFNKDAEPYKTLYLSSSADADKLTIDNLDPYVPFPHIDPNYRFSAYIHGNSGSGKTTTTANLIFLLLKAIPDIRFIYFTGIGIDEPLIKYFKYLFKEDYKNRLILFTPKSFIDIKKQNETSKNKLSIPLTVEELNKIQIQNSKIQGNNNTSLCCVFDDIDNINNPVIKKLLLNLEADILLTGRSHNKKGGADHIHIISISHIMTAQTPRIRRLLLETQWNIFNLKSQSDNHIINLIKNKYGYSDNETQEIIKQKHNSGPYLITFFSSSYPYIIFNNKSIMIS